MGTIRTITLATLASVLLSSTAALATVCDNDGNCASSPRAAPASPAPVAPVPVSPAPAQPAPSASVSYASPTPDCDQLGSIVGLNPHGDNNLSVHAAPYPRDTRDEIDELFTGDSVCIIGRDGSWDHVQYIRDGRLRTGWSSSSYIQPSEVRTRSVPEPDAISMSCSGFVMTFTKEGRLFSVKDNMTETDYTVTKVEAHPDGLTVRGLTKYGRVAVFYATSSAAQTRVFWTSDKEVVTQDCAIITNDGEAE